MLSSKRYVLANVALCLHKHSIEVQSHSCVDFISALGRGGGTCHNLGEPK